MSDNLKKLREPFPPDQISLLPRPTKKENPKGRCAECGGWHGLPAVHLSYVGHAALTSRLLDTDPAWTWEPLAMSPDGFPVMDNMGGMWIKLTVCGVTRLGYGHAGEKTGGDAIKEVIGDALRNAAMRFGAALDLWHKGDEPLYSDEPTSGSLVQKDGKLTRPKADKTLLMQVRRSISEHISQGREMGALQEWQLAVQRSEEFARDVWSGLTTPDQDEIRRLNGKAKDLEGALEVKD